MIFEWVPPILVYYIQFILWISSCTAVLGRSFSSFSFDCCVFWVSALWGILRSIQAVGLQKEPAEHLTGKLGLHGVPVKVLRCSWGYPLRRNWTKLKEIMIMKICIKMRLAMLTCYESSSLEERQWSETCLEIEQGRGPIRLRSRKSIKHESGPGHCLQKIIGKSKTIK